MLMKKLLFLIILATTFGACEDVVEVDLNEGTPKLVIEANFEKQIGVDDFILRVTLSKTIPFFNSDPEFVNDAVVTITPENENAIVVPFIEDGRYALSTIEPESGVPYTLEITVDGETYSATEMLVTGVPLEFVEQDNEGGFSNDEIELKAFFTDPPDTENYYFFEGLSSRGYVADALTDEFFDGNQIFGFYSVDDLEAGDQVTFYLSGVDEQFYNFMFTLLQQSGDQGGGPFETQPATVRGNIVNQTNEANFPLGYFRVSEVSLLTYTVE
tara:strand:- start:4072 stop:4884 length:813 start_codon:yes stop_codon:yes gene_type:complete